MRGFGSLRIGNTTFNLRMRGSMPGITISADLGEAHHHDAVPRPDVPDRAVLDTAGDLLRALAAPLRIAIVLQLCHSARCVHELVDALDVPQPLVSQHLRILKAAGVVAGTRSGREVFYRLADHHLADIVLAAVTHAAEHP
jgi:DNA-binding transcriptional ArsR family regulator